MSYQSHFLDALLASDQGEPLSSGVFVLCVLGNTEVHLERRALAVGAGIELHDAHVLAWRHDTALWGVSECFAQDAHAAFCPPAAASGTPRTVTAPVGSRQTGGTRLVNLDVHGRLVRKGCKVSYGGVRGNVERVSRGRCYVDYLDYLGRRKHSGEWLKCESLQVLS